MKRSRTAGRVAASAAMVILLFCAMGCSEDATDPKGLNDPPVVTLVSVQPDTVQRGGTATVSVDASDPDDDPITFTYHVSRGVVSPTGPVSTSHATWTAPQESGRFTVTVTALDDRGGSSSGQGFLVVTSQTTQTGVRGRGVLAAGQEGDLAGTRAAIYADFNSWSTDQPLDTMTVEGSGGVVTFAFTGVEPGVYLLDLWKDTDQMLSLNPGDYFGWYGTGTYPGDIGIISFEVRQNAMTDLGDITVSLVTVLKGRGRM